MMFSFEADMKKGQCSCCPLLDWSEERTEYICSMTGECIPLEVDPSDCPLEEYHGITWHPYPQEKPPHHGRFCVSYVNVKRSNRKEFHCVKYSNDGFASYDRFIYAWAELPKPFNPLIDDGNVLISATDEHVGERIEEEE